MSKKKAKKKHKPDNKFVTKKGEIYIVKRKGKKKPKKADNSSVQDDKK